MSEKPLRTLNSQFLVHIPKRVEDTIWIGGRELYFDGSYAEHFNKKLGGVVVGMPDRLGAEYLLQRRGYTPKNVPCSDIQDEVRAGDMLYVDWSVSEPHFEVPGLGPVYRATANQVVARVREGQLIPYGSYVFCKEIFPEGVQAVEVAGHTLQLRVSASGLALGSESIPPVPYQGEVVHVGLPLRGQPQRVKPGDRVVFDKRVCGKAEGLPLKMKIEGQEYLCIRQDYIEAVLEERKPLFHTVKGTPIYDGDYFWCFYEGQKESANRVRASARFDYNDGEPRFDTKEDAREAIRVYKWLNN
jgi:co-chaperonin GroES (HSP10)